MISPRMSQTLRDRQKHQSLIQSASHPARWVADNGLHSAAFLVSAQAQPEVSRILCCTFLLQAKQSPTSAPLAPAEMALPTSPGGPPSLVSPILGTLPLEIDGSVLLMASCTSACAPPAAGARAQMLRLEALNHITLPMPPRTSPGLHRTLLAPTLPCCIACLRNTRCHVLNNMPLPPWKEEECDCTATLQSHSYQCSGCLVLPVKSAKLVGGISAQHWSTIGQFSQVRK